MGLNVVIYHNDLDGRCSAAIAYRALKEENEVVLIEMDYDKSLPKLPTSIDKIYVLDFSFRDNKFDDLIKLVGKENVIWLDHHESVIIGLPQYADLPGTRTEEWSGAMLTWKWFHKDKYVPIVVSLVDDYDRWVMKFEQTLNFYEWSLGKGLEHITGKTWDELFDMNLFQLVDINTIGYDLRNRRYEELHEHIKKAGVPIRLIWNGKKYSCMKINSTFTNSTSQLGCIIYDELGYDVAWMHYTKIDDEGNLLQTNQLRSIKVDVSKIAVAKGGGGHINAAGYNEVIQYDAVNSYEVF